MKSIAGFTANVLNISAELSWTRWLTPPRDIAVLVVDSGNHHFEADLFHFGEQPREIGAELYLLEQGKYEWILHHMEKEKAKENSADFHVSGARTRITFTLPPQALCRLEVKRIN